MNISKNFKYISISIVTLCYLFISTGCEPDPKMIGYGSNEYSQLEFSGTNWNQEPLSNGYRNVWSGGNFSIALFYLGGPSPMDFVCTGDSSLNQCDIPEDLNPQLFFDSNFPPGQQSQRISLGLNHGMAIAPDTLSIAGEFSVFSPDRLFLWGDNSFEQTNMPDLPDTVSITKIVSGNNHNLILAEDITLQEGDSVSFYVLENRRLVAWGDNTYGQCDIPDMFNPIADSISIIKIDAGANHNVVLYDSSGVIKIASWGDNAYGQSDISIDYNVDENEKILDIFCGYNHNVVLTFDDQLDFYPELLEGAMIDELVNIFPVDQNDYYYYYYYYGESLLPTAYPLTLHAWGDNTYGQIDIPELNGIYEGLSVGGYHNNIVVSENIITNYGPGYTNQSSAYTVPQNREIIGWGKNDFGQTEFPIEYIFDAFDFSPDPNTVLANSPPIIAAGENHNLVIGPQVFRAPSMNFNYLDQFNGGYGDTVYQTLTLRNIGPDTLYLDSLILSGGSDTVGTHPFYMDSFEPEFILYGDSASFQIYSVFDSSHAQSENASIRIHTSGWFEETNNIGLNSYFGPIVNVGFPQGAVFTGAYDEIISREVKIRNTGNATVYIDSMAIRNSSSFYIEPLGDENSIAPGDSLSVYVYTTLLDIPLFYDDVFDLYISNFNFQQYSFGINARRFHKVGDNVSIGYQPNRNISFCSQMEVIGLQNPNSFSLLQLSGVPTELNTKIHHLDFGYLKSDLDSTYLHELHILNDQFRDNPSFLNMINAIVGFSPFPGYWYFSIDSCNQFLDDSFPLDYNAGFFLYDPGYFNTLFESQVESVILNENGEITYLDTFNLDSVTAAIELAIDECGIDCIASNALELSEDTSYVFIDQGSYFVDTVQIQNTTGFDLNYSLSSQSGSEIIRSAIFNSEEDNLLSNVELLSSPKTIALWLKPLTSDWSNNNLGYTNFISSIGNDTSETWKVILESSGPFARIGWKYGDNPAVLSQSPLWHANNTWYHCVFVHDVENQIFNMYKNGVWEATSTIENGITMGDQLGINIEGPGFFHGLLSKTAFWNSVLTPSEISYLYETGANNNILINSGDYISASNLSLYWDFNDSNGSIVNDHAGSNFHAILGGYIPGRWHSSVLPVDNQWLFPMTSNNGTANGNSSNISLYRVDAANLLEGTYYGKINLMSEQIPLSNSQTFIKLIVNENLNITSELLPLSYSLHQNYPNPFNPTTEIKYELPMDEFAEITIYDLMGRNVKNLISEDQVAGFHSIKWNATNNSGESVSAGMYFYSIKTNNFNQTRKMMLLK